VDRPGGRVVIHAKGAALDTPYIAALKVNGAPSDKPWLPSSFAQKGGTLDMTMSKTPNTKWGTPPPSFGPQQ
jgi:putative alpha-1,2-mannosidase